eukprot:gene45117-55191_t
MMDAVILCANIARSPNPLISFDLLYVVLNDYLCHFKLSESEHSEKHYRNNADREHLVFKATKIPYFIPVAIEVEVVSKDQGWSNNPDQHGQRNSSTWGELALSAVPEERYHVYTNIHAGKVLETHVKIFREHHAVVKQLQHLWRSARDWEDVVDVRLMARSMHQGWTNAIADAKITVIYKLAEGIKELVGPRGRRLFRSRFPPRYALTAADQVVLLKNIARTRSKLPLPEAVLFGILKDYLPKPKVARESKQHRRVGSNANHLHLHLPLSKLQFHVPISIVIKVNSKDQGWSSYPDEHGMRNSWSWGELALSVRAGERHRVYTNIHAGQDWEVQTKSFGPMDDVMQGLCAVLLDAQQNPEVPLGGHVVDLQLFLRSQFPGWENHIKHASISVEYMLTDDALKL